MKYPNKSGKWSHLVCDDLNFLHDFAKKIGIKTKFQNKKKKNKKEPHYDMPVELVAVALKNGAVQVTRKEVFLFLMKHFN